MSVAAAAVKESSFSFYFAGSLFSGRELEGNARLCEAIERLSKGRFRALLPQNLQMDRDADLKLVMSSSLMIAQFDGTELDSGTVVEYMMAKMADVPTLLLRTDFRAGGDKGSNPWNLMASGFPRTEVLVVNSIELYQAALQEQESLSAGDTVKVAAQVTDQIAMQVIEKLEALLKLSPIMPAESQKSIFEWLALFPGFKEGDESAKRFTERVLKGKKESGLL